MPSHPLSLELKTRLQLGCQTCPVARTICTERALPLGTILALHVGDLANMPFTVAEKIQVDHEQGKVTNGTVSSEAYTGAICETTGCPDERILELANNIVTTLHNSGVPKTFITIE